MKRPGSFRKSGDSPRKSGDSPRKSGGNPRKPQNRQGGQSGKSQNPTNASPRKGGIHPWVSSSASSSQALTSHISIASNKAGNSNNRKPQNAKNPYRQKRDNSNNPSGQAGDRPSYQDRPSQGRPNQGRPNQGRPNQGRPNQGRPNQGRPNRGEGRTQPSRPAANAPVKNPAISEKPLTGNLDPFSLFCAYHLGIGPNKDYKPANLNEVARRFGQDPATVRQALKECDMDSASLLDREFDMALAQLDIQVAPEGIDRMELAKSIYEDFLDAPHVKRDWKKILDEDRKENRKVFG